MATRTEEYFLRLFDCATLNAAVERAAEHVRAEHWTEGQRAPIDVFKLAASRGVHVAEDLTGANCPEGLLLPRNKGYAVRLKRDATTARKRFSLAHELGHTLFYEDKGSGPRHVIGILDRAERTAEERICDRFAECLLVPTSEISGQFRAPQGPDASRFLTSIERAASFFSVSPYVIISRLQSLKFSEIAFLVICSSLRPNPKTSGEPTLRVDFCASLGGWENRFVWKHRALRSIGLAGAVLLYEVWNRNRAQGAFSLSKNQTLVIDCDATDKMGESVAVSRIAKGKWRTVEESCLSASRLYSWKTNTEEPDAYVISVLSPAQAGGPPARSLS